MFSTLNSLLRREGIRSAGIGQNIRPKGQHANIFIRRSFFHSKTFVRPPLGPQALKYPKGSNLFWAYLNAPGNMLFLTTNFLSLGILFTYRCLNTIANADRVTSNEIDTYAQMHFNNDFMRMDHLGDRFDLLKSHYKADGVLAEEDINDEHEVDASTEGLPLLRSSTELEQDVAEEEDTLPLTDSELDAYGPPIIRYIEKERIQQLLINQLLSIHQIRNMVLKVFNSEGTDLMLLNEYSTETQADLISVLYDNITQNNSESEIKITTLEELSSYLPAKYVSNALKTSRIPYLENELYKFNEDSLKDEDFENIGNPNMKSINTEAIKSVMEKHDKNSEDLYLDLALLLMNSKIPQNAKLSDIFAPFLQTSKKNTEETNENIITNLSILMSSFFRTSRIEKISTDYKDVLESSISVKDKTALSKALKDLNIDYESLLHNKRNRSKFAMKVRKSFKGERRPNLAHKTSIDVRLYITAIQGLIDLNFEASHIQKAINKVFKGFHLSGGKGKVLFSNDQKPRKEATIIALKKIPYTLLKQALWVSNKTQNRSLLNWCFNITQVHEEFSPETQERAFAQIKDVAESIGDKDILYRIRFRI